MIIAPVSLKTGAADFDSAIIEDQPTR